MKYAWAQTRLWAAWLSEMWAPMQYGIMKCKSAFFFYYCELAFRDFGSLPKTSVGEIGEHPSCFMVKQMSTYVHTPMYFFSFFSFFL